MGLFSRSTKTLEATEGMQDVLVVGDEDFIIVRTLHVGPVQKVTLERELGNRRDPYATLVRVNSQAAGYLSNAADYAFMVSGRPLPVPAVLRLDESGKKVLFVLMPEVGRV